MIGNEVVLLVSTPKVPLGTVGTVTETYPKLNKVTVKFCFRIPNTTFDVTRYETLYVHEVTRRKARS